MNQSEMISALGLDIGRKRIGVAGCDRTGLIASGLTTLEGQSFPQVVAQLQTLIQTRQVTVLVVGLPYTMDGQVGTQARQVQRFTHRLADALGLPVDYVDERLTTFHAKQLLLAEQRSPARHRALVDRKAAALILQTWLDQRRADRAADQSPPSIS
jgi:putative Holliday junction resolvase